MIGRTLLLAAGFALAANAAHAGLTQIPKTAPNRYSADQAFFAFVLTPGTFCRSVGLHYVVAGPGCGGMIVHDHKEGPTSPTAFVGANGANFIGIPDNWWLAVKAGKISPAYLQIVVAHEEGHLICGHPGHVTGRPEELIADRIAGAAMRSIWYGEHRSIDYIKAAITEAYGSLPADDTHPDGATRSNAFVDGYLDPAKATCSW